MREIAALLVGINQYPVFPLNFCVSDIHRVQAYFNNGMYHPAEGDLRVLTDEAATKQAILDGLDWLSGQLVKTALFYYSGHGTTIPDLDGDEGSGKPDQAIVPVDWARGLLVDDEIQIAMSRIAAEKLVAIFDCCHSGRLDRSFDFLRTQWARTSGRKRRGIDASRMPREVVVRGFETARTLAYRVQNPKLISIAACLDTEVAEETVFPDGSGNGVLSYHLFESVRSLSKSSYESVITATRRGVRAGDFAQHIQLRAGTPALLKNRFLR